MEFHKLKIKKIVKETSDSVSVEFEVNDGLLSDWEYEPGQYLNLETHVDGENVRRSYSICTAPDEQKLKVCIKQIRDGLFSTFANSRLQEGDTLKVSKPDGGFMIKPHTNNEGTYLFFAAGSGITPIISMIKYLLKNNIGNNIVLFYGNRNTDSIIFREEIESLKNLYLDRFSVHYILSKEMPSNKLYSGRLNAEKCEVFAKYFFDANDVIGAYLCGPASMIFDIEKTLINTGITKENIHFELFTTEGIVRKEMVEDSSFDPSKESKIQVKVDGLTLKFTLPYGGDNILDSAMEHGADLPYSCKGGVCSTCKAKLIKGEVKMDVNYALEKDELDSGYILTCQSHPRTEELIVDFDV